MIEPLQNAVRDFMTKHNYRLGQPLKATNNHATVTLMAASRTLREYSKATLDIAASDLRAERAHSLLKQLSETLEGLANYDEAYTLDGLCDMAYVVSGCALAFDLPLESGLVEVHSSNMSKDIGSTSGSSLVLHPRGPNYRPPNLKQVLADYKRTRAHLKA